MKVVTAGYRFLDIDAYAGCIAYAELLQRQGLAAEAVSTSVLNESIPQSVRSWNAPLRTAYTPSSDDMYILVDVSDPEKIEKTADINRVEQVIDHHLGFEEYWQSRIGDKADIQFIGAACTRIYELWKEAGLLDEMSQLSAKLLVCGILDNTLNFRAHVTTDRDKAAYDDLLKRSGLPDDWPQRYFEECQAAILRDIGSALEKDLKIIQFRSFPEPLAVGQLAVWEGSEVLSQNAIAIQKVLEKLKPHWFMNLISIGENRSYFFSTDPQTKDWLAQLLSLNFTDSIASADRLWLRKEINKQDILTHTPT